MLTETIEKINAFRNEVEIKLSNQTIEQFALTDLKFDGGHGQFIECIITRK